MKSRDHWFGRHPGSLVEVGTRKDLWRDDGTDVGGPQEGGDQSLEHRWTRGFHPTNSGRPPKRRGTRLRRTEILERSEVGVDRVSVDRVPTGDGLSDQGPPVLPGEPPPLYLRFGVFWASSATPSQTLGPRRVRSHIRPVWTYTLTPKLPSPRKNSYVPGGESVRDAGTGGPETRETRPQWPYLPPGAWQPTPLDLLLRQRRVPLLLPDERVCRRETESPVTREFLCV